MTNQDRDVWRIELVPNTVQQRPDGKPAYRAKLRSARVVYHVEKIIDELQQDGSAIDRDTIAGIVHRFVNRCKRLVRQGYAVRLDDLVKIEGKVEGSWEAGDTPSEGTSKITLTLGTYNSFIEQLQKQVRLEFSGHQQPNATALIINVKDHATNKQDGTITPGDDITIKGEKIKIAGDNDEQLEDELGVFFVPVNGGTPVKALRMDHNAASYLQVRVPQLPTGQQFNLHIVTKYTGANLLAEPRTINAPFLLHTADDSATS